MSPLSDTLSSFRANQSLFFLLNPAVFGLNPSGLEPTICWTRGEYAKNYTNDAVMKYKYAYSDIETITIIPPMRLYVMLKYECS
jgi:hypothetical protein